ncbi:type II toxin-antitoxin system VapC family toxin [Agrococcus beijingensis]|uniref:type II toxin-antitoxin system VapC family toxin n=1 Tax=Agrococcus beijingensis TaxID=3068634 RepID=UPI002741C5B2|nr:type II toxin-antitoxin system VapC family toxin [Agrococcus sp. REN33]
MIVLDTNVLSEPMRRRPDPGVIAWLSAHADRAAITAVSVAELQYGVQRLDAGRRRDALQGAIDRMERAAADRLLAFDRAAARRWGSLRAERERLGRPMSLEDGMIAAICLVGEHDLATRNLADFEGLGITLHDPWQVGG